jgi:hypothetical protein
MTDCKRTFSDWSVRYSCYLNSYRWRTRRRDYLDAVGWCCEDCQRNWADVVHHRSYQNLGHELDSDLEALCHDCHARRHGMSMPKAANDNNPLQLKFDFAGEG